jgi:hypothetical protein
VICKRNRIYAATRPLLDHRLRGSVHKRTVSRSAEVAHFMSLAVLVVKRPDWKARLEFK